jgi:hypothetical protein
MGGDVAYPRSSKRATFIVVVLVSAVLLAGCDWVMYRSNAAHTGESPGEKVIGVGNVATLSEAWTTNHDTTFDNVVGRDPVVAGGRLYVHTANGFLSAYDADGIDNCGGSPKECDPVWRAQPGGGVSPAVVGGVVYNVSVGVLSDRRASTHDEKDRRIRRLAERLGAQFHPVRFDHALGHVTSAVLRFGPPSGAPVG